MKDLTYNICQAGKTNKAMQDTIVAGELNGVIAFVHWYSGDCHK